MATYYVSPDPPGKVLAYYRDMLLEQGWLIGAEDSNSLEFYPRAIKDDDRDIVIQVSLAADGQTLIEVRRVRVY